MYAQSAVAAEMIAFARARVTTRLVAVLGAAALAATGCAVDRTIEGVAESEAGAEFPPGAGVVPDGLEQFYTQQLDWGSCESFSTDGTVLPSSVSCAYVSVPLDYEDPAGETASIAISRSEAAGKKIGSILFNPGGPGSSGLYLATQAESSDISDRFDRIGFDPRGIGAASVQEQPVPVPSE
nr:hypothetical protein [uncultured Rhodococcus sp.]